MYSIATKSAGTPRLSTASTGALFARRSLTHSMSHARAHLVSSDSLLSSHVAAGTPFLSALVSASAVNMPRPASSSSL